MIPPAWRRGARAIHHGARRQTAAILTLNEGKFQLIGTSGPFDIPPGTTARKMDASMYCIGPGSFLFDQLPFDGTSFTGSIACVP